MIVCEYAAAAGTSGVSVERPIGIGPEVSAFEIDLSSRARHIRPRMVAGAEQRAERSGLRYPARQEAQLALLDARRQLHAARRAVPGVRRDGISDAVTLCKPCGGGLAGTLPVAADATPSTPRIE